MATHAVPPLPVRFHSTVHLTLHEAFLPTAGVLLSDPIARVHVVTVKTTRTRPLPVSAVSFASADASTCEREEGIRVVLNTREVAKTKPSFFTAHPTFNESFNFSVSESSALTSLAAPNKSSSSSSSSKNKKRRITFDDDNTHDDDEVLRGDADFSSVVDYVVVTIESADGTAFYGEAYAPFSPHCSSSVPCANPARVMLAPRNAQDAKDPLFLQDNALLEEKRLDDFGFVTMSWEVTVVPHGGALLGAAKADENDSNDAGAAPFPVGLTLRATWLVRAVAYTRGTQYTTSVEFGGSERFLFSATHKQPLCLTLQSGAGLQRAIFHCTVQSVTEPTKSHDVVVPLPLPPLHVAAARNRDVHWTAPVRTACGLDLGLLLVSMRVSSKPLQSDAPRCPDEACARINDPLHQEECQHVAQLYGATEPPACPSGAFQPIAWASASHVEEAKQRQWKRQCVVEAQPTVEHVRHIFDVLMGRTTLDAGVATVAAKFYTKSPAEVTAGDLRELMIAFAFHASKLTVQEAARFCFVALRRDVPDAVAASEVHYMLDHCLLEGTIEMPAEERRRWITDLFSDVPVVSYSDFVTYFLHNYALWAATGVPLTVAESFSSVQHQHAALQPYTESAANGAVVDVSSLPAAAAAAGSPSAPRSVAASVTASPVAPAGGGRIRSLSNTPVPRDGSTAPTSSSAAAQNVWRTFVVRVAATPLKAFSVTAHVDDLVRDVMAMVEGSANVPATRQEWRLGISTHGSSHSNLSNAAADHTGNAPPASSLKLVDPSLAIGSTTLGLPSAFRSSAAQEVWIYEAEESVLLRFHVKDRLHTKRDWQERVQVKEKVLKVRAAVQRKTLIPISRCVLTVRRGGGQTFTLQDRHTVGHYHLVSGDVIDVSQE